MRNHSTIFFALSFSTLGASHASAAWETVTHDGHDYVTARSIKEFYKFDTMDVRGKRLVLRNDVVTCMLPLQGTEAYFNNLLFHLPFPLVQDKDRYLVSRVTLAKIIDPVLRPSSIPSPPGLFNTVVFDYEAPPFKEGPNLARQIAQNVSGLLTKRGAKVVLTQPNQPATLDERLTVINDLDNAVVLSLQLRKDDAQEKGLRTWILSPAELPGGKLKMIPGNAHDGLTIALATALHGAAILRTERPDRGIACRHDPLLDASKHPTVILELGNLSNDTETRLLTDERFHRAIDRAVAEALDKAKKAISPRAPAE